jgi:hypothetical protein
MANYRAQAGKPMIPKYMVRVLFGIDQKPDRTFRLDLFFQLQYFGNQLGSIYDHNPV